MQWLGDFPEDATVYIPFNTFTSNDPQASATITNLADADIKVHKDGSVTQIVTDGATVAIDFDSITGNHLITIDTSAHADYAIGSDYMVRMEGTTVDGGTINAWIGTFSIENRFNEVDVVKWLGTAAATPTTAGVPSVALTAIGLDAISQAATGMVEIAKAVWDRLLTGATHNITNSAGKRLRQIDAAFEVHSGTAQAGAAGTITLDTGASATNDIYRGDRCIIVAGTGVQEHGIVIAYNGTTKVATMAENWVITPDATSEFVLVPADVDIETWQHNVVTGDGDWAAMQADLDVITDADGVILGAAGVDLIHDEPMSGHQTAGTAGRYHTLAASILNETTATGTPTTTTIQLTAGSAIDDFYNDQLLYITSGTGAGQVRVVSDYTGATKTCTVDEAFSTTPVATDGVIIRADHVHSISSIQSGLATEAKQDVIDTNIDNLLLGVIFGAAATGTLSTTQATSDLTGYTNDQLIGRIITVTSGVAEGESSAITDYVEASGLLTFDAMTLAMGNADTFKIT